ncbi:MAG: hypothetical protein ACUVV4_08800 [Candidatus Bathyarchaeia archaeon]
MEADNKVVTPKLILWEKFCGEIKKVKRDIVMMTETGRTHFIKEEKKRR